MNKKKILILDANPSSFSFTSCLAEEYFINAEKSGFEVKTINIRDLKFDPNLKFGYNRKQTIEPDLKEAQDLLLWCNHLVIFSPVWWYSMPAILKGFFDRVLLPEFAFMVKNNPTRQLIKLLNGKTATVVYAYGAPHNIFLQLFDPFKYQLKYGILDFVGFKNIHCYPLYKTLGFANMKRRNKFLEKIGKLGREGK